MDNQTLIHILGVIAAFEFGAFLASGKFNFKRVIIATFIAVLIQTYFFS